MHTSLRPLKSCQWFVVSVSNGTLVLDVESDALSLRPFTDIILFNNIYEIAAVKTAVP